MSQENKKQTGTQAGPKSDETVDLSELAKKIVALLLRELDIERERTGR